MFAAGTTHNKLRIARRKDTAMRFYWLLFIPLLAACNASLPEGEDSGSPSSGAGECNSTCPAGAEGPAGPQGEAGPAGPAGLPGEPGLPGAAGVAGDSCTVTPGVFGATIHCGSTQANIPHPADGADGAPGAVGPQGPQGIQGAQGPQGATGPAGKNGLADPSKLYWKTATKPLVAYSGSGSLEVKCNDGDFVMSGNCLATNGTLMQSGAVNSTQGFAGIPDSWWCTIAVTQANQSASVTTVAVCVEVEP